MYFSMHADMTAVKLQSSKIVSNEVNELRTTRAILRKEKNVMGLLANAIHYMFM